jgi:hypothetical protein
MRLLTQSGEEARANVILLTYFLVFGVTPSSLYFLQSVLIY